MATHDFGLTWLGNGGQQVQYCRETYSKAVETLVCNSGEPSSVTSFNIYLDNTYNSLLLEGKIQEERPVMVGQFSVTGIEIEDCFSTTSAFLIFFSLKEEGNYYFLSYHHFLLQR